MCQLFLRGVWGCESAHEPMPTVPQLAQFMFESMCKPPALERKPQGFYEGYELKHSDIKKCAQCSAAG